MNPTVQGTGVRDPERENLWPSEGPDVLSMDLLTDCIHCGLCLPACPTYMELGNELDSPRGRIYLMRGVAEGLIGYTPIVQRHLDLCLGCRACETACPSGVQYGRLIEVVRVGVEKARGSGSGYGWLRRMALRHLLPHPTRLSKVAVLLDFYRRSGLRNFLKASGFFRLVPKQLLDLEAMMPPISSRALRREVGKGAGDTGTRKPPVALQTGCVMSLAFSHIHRATIQVLAENGYPVLVPEAQICCGALHGHSGDRETARRLARKNIDSFLASGAKFVITNSAGCGSFMKEYGELLKVEPGYRERAERFSEKVWDISEFLVSQGFRSPRGILNLRVTYHEACHLVHAQKVRRPPRDILRSFPGLTLVELSEADVCCGSAGTYNLTEPEMAERLLERKVRHIEETEAPVVAMGNPGCLIQIAGGLRRRGLSVRVVHPVELLAEAYEAERPDGKNPRSG